MPRGIARVIRVADEVPELRLELEVEPRPPLLGVFQTRRSDDPYDAELDRCKIGGVARRRATNDEREEESG
jgi:hypothetical protein